MGGGYSGCRSGVYLEDLVPWGAVMLRINSCSVKPENIVGRSKTMAGRPLGYLERPKFHLLAFSADSRAVSQTPSSIYEVGSK